MAYATQGTTAVKKRPGPVRTRTPRAHPPRTTGGTGSAPPTTGQTWPRRAK